MLFAFLLTFVIGGFWHGAAWTFVVWGLLHGLALVVVHFWRKLGHPLPRVLAIAVTFLFVSAAFVVFRAASLPDAGAILASIAGLKGIDARLTVAEWSWLARSAVPRGELYSGVFTLAALGIALVLALTPRNSMHVSQALNLAAMRPRLAFALLLTLSLVFVQNATEFIYFIF